MCIKVLYLIYLSILLALKWKVILGDGGLAQAVTYLRQPIPRMRETNDIILSGISTPWEENAYKLQVIRVRLGIAWELATTDFGFQQMHPIDIVNHHRKIAIELKNNKRISSTEKRVKHADLLAFKRRHRDYTVIFGFINGGGHDTVKDGIQYMHGQRLLQLMFGRSKNRVIRQFREAVRSHLL